MEPATSPAMAQATATVTQLLAPASSASTNFEKVRLSLLSSLLVARVTRLLKRPTRIVIPIATAAENCMVRLLVETSQTSTTSGSSRYTFGRSSRKRGSSLRGMPLRPSFFASRWTAM